MKTENNKPILYIDMDETLFDFSGSPELKNYDRTKKNPPQMYEANFFQNLRPLPGAISSVIKILNSDKYDTYILTQPVAKSPISYTEKVNCIYKHLPDLGEKIIMTQDKTLNIGDWLVDDDEKWSKPHPVHGRMFKGKFIHFKIDVHSIAMWEKVLDILGVK